MTTQSPPKPPKTPQPIVYDPRKSLEGYPDTQEDKNFVLKVKNARPKVFSESKFADTVKRPLTATEKIWYSHLEAGNPEKKGSILYLTPDLLLFRMPQENFYYSRLSFYLHFLGKIKARF